MELEAVFAMDWYTDTGERRGLELDLVDDPDRRQGGADAAAAVRTGYLTIPNLSLLNGLVHRVQQKLSLTQPLFRA